MITTVQQILATIILSGFAVIVTTLAICAASVLLREVYSSWKS